MHENFFGFNTNLYVANTEYLIWFIRLEMKKHIVQLYLSKKIHIHSFWFCAVLFFKNGEQVKKRGGEVVHCFSVKDLGRDGLRWKHWVFGLMSVISFEGSKRSRLSQKEDTNRRATKFCCSRCQLLFFFPFEISTSAARKCFVLRISPFTRLWTALSSSPRNATAPGWTSCHSYFLERAGRVRWPV